MISTIFAEGEIIRNVVITGRHSMTEKQQEAVRRNLLGQPFNPEMVQRNAEYLRKICMRDFYPLTNVKWKAIPLVKESGVHLVYSVERGPRGRLQEIDIEGNHHFTDGQLLEGLKVVPRKSWWPGLLMQDALDPDQLRADRNSLRLQYLESGYAAVEVEPALLERTPDRNGFRLTWKISNEGPVHGIGSIAFDADLLPPEAVVEKIVNLKPDERYNAFRIEEVRAALQRYYVENGHAFARVDLAETRNPGENRVDLVFQILAGRRPVLRNTILEGQKRTKDQILLNEISLKPGEVFDPLKLEASKSRLDQLPMFSRVDVKVEGVPEAGVFDLKVTVRERKTGRVEGGLVYGDAEGAALQLNLSERNLDLVPPFKGGGYEAGGSATLGNEVIRGELRLSDPRVGNSDWSLNGTVFYEDSEVVSSYYDQKSYGGQLVGAHPLQPGFTGSVGFSVLFAQLYNIDRSALPDLDDIDENLRLTSLVSFLGFDQTDESFRPTKGIRGRVGVRIGTEALGGNVNVVEGTLKTTVFVNPFDDHVMLLKGGVDGINPYGGTEKTPQALKQYLGGGQTLRGFEYRSVSPLDERGRTVGGDTRWWVTAEYLFPVVKDRLDLALFYDVGDVSPESFSFSGEGPVSNAGIGLAVRADNFPVRFNVAMPLQTYENDQVNEKGDYYISFTVGYQY